MARSLDTAGSPSSAHPLRLENDRPSRVTLTEQSTISSRIFRGLARRTHSFVSGTSRAVSSALRYPGWRRRLHGGPLHIGVQTVAINTFDGFVWGDECMARGLAAACRKLGHTTEVVSAQAHDIAAQRFDVMIAMYPTGDIPGLPQRITLPPVCLNLYWAQVPGHYRLAENDPRFAGFLFASLNEMNASAVAHKLWMPMSADPETYRPQPATAPEFDAVLCANNIKGRSPATLERYLAPLLDMPNLKFSIRGSGWEGTRYAPYAHGPIHPTEVPRLYGNARVVLSIHGDSHFAADMPTSRLFEAAGCGCATLSDALPTARKIFGDTICWTTGGDDAREKLAALLADAPRRRALGEGARREFLRDHTFDAHARRLDEFIRSILRSTA